MSDIQQITLASEHTAILRRCQNAFCHAVTAKFNCTAILQHMERAGSFASNSGVFQDEKRYSTNLSSRVEISVWKGDLTRHKVDAVVNAANDKLKHGGGLAQALSEAGGPMIQKWSDDITQVQRLKTGDAVLTLAGNLPCKYIIHAVGPYVSPNPTHKELDGAAPYLRNAIFEILEIAVRENISSVAIPALSSGLFNFPRNLCADIIVKAIKQFHDHNRFRGKNLEIRLVNNDEPSVQEMMRATRATFEPFSISGSYSGVVQGRNLSMTSSSSNSLQFGNVTLHLKTGYIEEEKVDVIVNTIAKECNLSYGEVTKAILRKAGGSIQDEIYRQKNKRGKGFGDPYLYETNGYGLQCKEVFHTVCANSSDPNSVTILSKVVSECLAKAASRHTSISFPAIGTGNLGLDKYQVAQIMMNTVAEFAKQGRKLDVHFVVFPKDHEMMKAFEKEMKTRKEQTKTPFSPNNMTRSFGSEAKETTANETPTVEFHGVSKEARREAQAWTLNMLKHSNYITIRNNHVVYLDQRNHENLLSIQAKFNVGINEFFRSGNGGITITGSPSDVSCAAIEVESMLCEAQENFTQTEEHEVLYSVVRWSCKDKPFIQTPENSAALEKAYLAGKDEFTFMNHKFSFRSMILYDNSGKVSSMKRTCLLDLLEPLNNSYYARTPVSSKEYGDKEGGRTLKASGLRIVKVEKLENIALMQLFNKNGQRVKSKPQRLYQRVSAQFCDLICRVGFQKEFAPPAEQKYGSGIYFSSTVDGALKLWKEQDDEQYIYIIQAQVLTGKSTIGSQDFILPPARTGDPLDRFDSVSDMGQTHVIFSSQQALPEYLIICSKPTPV